LRYFLNQFGHKKRTLELYGIEFHRIIDDFRLYPILYSHSYEAFLNGNVRRRGHAALKDELKRIAVLSRRNQSIEGKLYDLSFH